MDQQQPYGAFSHPEPEPDPVPAPTRRRVPRIAIAAGVTTFLALGGAGLAFATGGGGTPSASLSSSSSSTTVPDHPHKGWGGQVRPGLGMGGGRNVVHGEYTIGEGGTFKSVTIQSGQVTSVSPTSITVQSADGYVQTYTVEPSTVVDSQAGGISTVAAKDQVRVEGLVQGSNRTATDVVDVTKVGDSRKGFGMANPGRPGMPGMPTMPVPGAPLQGAIASA